MIKLGRPCKKFAQIFHLEKFHWLVFSHIHQGLYCVYCALFATTGKDFAENTERLRPIRKTIIFYGHQNIALRGHRDDGPMLTINNDESVVVASAGNFIALSKFRIDAGDTVLQKHLETVSSNATYISKTVQNELIDICKAKIQETIFQNIKSANLFSLMFDETTDISYIEQLSLSFRYNKDGSIREDFACFCDAYNMVGCEEKDSGKELRLTGEKIVENLCYQIDVDLSFRVGICTDNSLVMAFKIVYNIVN